MGCGGVGRKGRERCAPGRRMKTHADLIHMEQEFWKLCGCLETNYESENQFLCWVTRILTILVNHERTVQSIQETSTKNHNKERAAEGSPTNGRRTRLNHGQGNRVDLRGPLVTTEKTSAQTQGRRGVGGPHIKNTAREAMPNLDAVPEKNGRTPTRSKM